MNGYDFLDLAVRLSASRKEADLRSAVSRAYYSAYHLEMSVGLRRLTVSQSAALA